MMPRYGKNYSIIPQLVPGPINIQILFQQNIYPPQKFTVVVPENGFRGFLLMQKNGVFSLYDVHQQFYLQPGNKAEDDRIAPHINSDTYVYKGGSTLENTEPTSVVPKPRQQKPESISPKFLPNIELSNERYVQPASPQPVVTEKVEDNSTYTEPVIDTDKPGPVSEPLEEPVIVPANNNTFVANSDCPDAVNEGAFEDLYNKVQSRSEKVKLKFLLTKVTECYSTSQARLLAETLDNDPERYTFLKKVYPRITDQYNFSQLENLLSTQEWKGYFKLILSK